jgi:hypothetical protein
VRDIDLKVISVSENSNKFQKNQVFEGKISWGRGNTWANGTGHTSWIWYLNWIHFCEICFQGTGSWRRGQRTCSVKWKKLLETQTEGSIQRLENQQHSCISVNSHMYGMWILCNCQSFALMIHIYTFECFTLTFIKFWCIILFLYTWWCKYLSNTFMWACLRHVSVHIIYL